jgi:hypothetical protein
LLKVEYKKMTNQQKLIFKNKLKQVCKTIIELRINAAKAAIMNAQQAANSEEKSSAGDKYETSRAMSHLEKDMHARQLTENLKELATLHAIDVNTIYTVGKPGAFLQCSGASFFIAAGLGKQVIETDTIFFLSPNAPLAKVLQNKKEGDSFLFNTIQTTIKEIF